MTTLKNSAPDGGVRGGGNSAPVAAQKPLAAETHYVRARRSQRVSIVVPILVYGREKDGEPFQEETQSLVVNAHGGLILLTSPVVLEQTLVLTNPKNMVEARGKVAFLGRKENGKIQVGVEFTEPSPRFWHITFPPPDWNPSERKLPSSSRR